VEGGGQVEAEVDRVEDEMDVKLVLLLAVPICVDDGVCAPWGGVQVGFASCGVVCSSRAGRVL
jgi:hypothetical protein